MVAQESLPHVWVSFTLTGDSFDPDAVTAALGVEPTSQHRKGDQRGRTARWPRARWRVTIGPRDTIEIDVMLAELLAYMTSNDQTIKRVCGEFGLEATITCAVEPTSALTPAVQFPPEVVQWAAERDVAIDVDVMIWRDDAEDGPAPPAIGA
jgi:Domain of unknown function (DUF4279)